MASIKKTFVNKGIRKLTIEEYLRNSFQKAGYSHSDIRRTPLGMQITVHADRVGLIIGRGGQTINAMTEKLEKDYGLENPRLNVEEIGKPFLNAKIVAEEIKNAVEKKVNHRKICNIMMQRILAAGAVGCQIRISGRIGGAKSRRDKFNIGYLKHSGQYAKDLVDTATVEAQTKLSSIGIKVKIMRSKPEADIASLRAIMEKRPEAAQAVQLRCPVCSKDYDNERSLKIHIGQRHPEAQAPVASAQADASPPQEDTKVAQLLEGNVSDVRKKIEDARRPDVKLLLRSEKEGKNRKGVVEYLERRVAEKEAKS
ncbi:MAG: 30S ribosomal protein S3 [Candidatus Aenigmatarchaeota archaeon]|nr:MAG: 30S ribosomal protein S3 [Candidatus Aenigmarchaeota archaeon]